MPTPVKSVAVLRSGERPHRSKAELAQREQAEKAALTGESIKETAEVKADKIAHAEFRRLKRILANIGRDDELYGAPTRRYCLNASKLHDADVSVERLKGEVDQLVEDRDSFDDLQEYYKLLTKLEDSVTRKEQLSKSIRQEMDSFEKENSMTIKSSIRTVPPKQTTKKSALLEALSG
jgi:hypothetical protein